MKQTHFPTLRRRLDIELCVGRLGVAAIHGLVSPASSMMASPRHTGVTGLTTARRGTIRMPLREQPWRRYQDDVADLLTELGFAVQVEDRLTSARGVTHEVDVSARRTVAGVEVLWVVECKLWRSRISKEKVAALAAICDDLGSDRGLLMSQNGFQAGAIQMAVGRSITLTSLEDLRSTASEDLQRARQNQAEHRLRAAEMALHGMQPTTIGDQFGEVLKAIYKLGLSKDEQIRRAEEQQTRPTRQDVMAVVFEQIPDIAQRVESDLQRAKVSEKEWVAHVLQARLDTAADEATIDGLLATVKDRRTVLNEAALGQWPVLIQDETGQFQTCWGMRQLLDVLERCLDQLELRIHAERWRIDAAPHGRAEYRRRVRNHRRRAKRAPSPDCVENSTGTP
ncbi:restriction endonuclease [Nocardia sp. NPDC060259]|uniref:restriction endonuclease n=1 Tax=Nocardia sp. NPDC060259 TaxID=3347088 RepID=UPI00365693B2